MATPVGVKCRRLSEPRKLVESSSSPCRSPLQVRAFFYLIFRLRVHVLLSVRDCRAIFRYEDLSLVWGVYG